MGISWGVMSQHFVKTCQGTKRMAELVLESSIVRKIKSYTREEKLKIVNTYTRHAPQKLSISRNMANNSSILEETDSKFVMVVALLQSQVYNYSNKWPPDLLVNVITTNYALESTCLKLSHAERVI